MLPTLLNTTVDVKRRPSTTSASRDALNNPVYGAPTAGWTTVYTAMPARLAFNRKKIEFVKEGERVLPYGILYIGRDFILLPEDRIITTDAIEYVVTSVVPAFLFGAIVDHYECELELP